MVLNMLINVWRNNCFIKYNIKHSPYENADDARNEAQTLYSRAPKSFILCK